MAYTLWMYELAGESSLGAAISSLDWVSSHDQLGRNDPTRQGWRARLSRRSVTLMLSQARSTRIH